MNILKRVKNNFIRFFFYIFFGLFCFLIFFLIKFPFDIFVDNLLSSLEKEYNVEISVRESGYSFPIGIQMAQINIKGNNDNLINYDIDNIKVKYPFFSLFFFKKEFAFETDAFDGTIYGLIASDTDGIYLNIKTSKEINLQKAFPEITKKELSLTGLTKISIEGIINNNDIKAFSGSGKVEISSGQIRNVSPLLEVIPVEKALLEFESSRGQNAIKNIKIEGNGVIIKGQGIIKIGKTFNDSSLNLKLFGEYNPSTETGKTISLLGIKGKKNIPIEFSGSLSKPTLKIEGKYFWNKRTRSAERR